MSERTQLSRRQFLNLLALGIASAACAPVIDEIAPSPTFTPKLPTEVVEPTEVQTPTPEPKATETTRPVPTNIEQLANNLGPEFTVITTQASLKLRYLLLHI